MAEKKDAADEVSFGTDGWRGRIARDFTFRNVRRAAQAVADYLKTEPKLAKQQVLIGYDYRFQSLDFAREAANVLAANKLKPVIFAEVLPTPALSYMTKKSKGIGIMFTASHNPAEYNGMKIKMDGRAAPLSVTKAVESHLGKSVTRTEAKVPLKSFRAAYLSYLKSKGNAAKIARGLKGKVVVDYMYGNGQGLFEQLIPAKRIVALRAEKDPLFGGIHPEPREGNLDELQKAVKGEKAVAGLAFDGDADRLAVVDDAGRCLTPCQLFPLMVEYLFEARKLKGKVVQSLSLGYLSERVAKSLGLAFEEVPVGFKHVAEKMLADDASFGGEESGGYAWKGTLPERDGMLAALLVLEMIQARKKPLSKQLDELEEKYGKSVFLRRDLPLTKPVASKQAFTERMLKKVPKKVLGAPPLRTVTMDGLKVYAEHGHWVLLRPSGTEPLVRVYAESDSEKRTEALLDLGQKWLRPLLAKH